MRSDIVTGAVFPDYELSDHTGKRRKLLELQQHDPMIVVLSRGAYCPKDRRQHEGLVQLHRELDVGYCRLVTISTGNLIETNEFRTGVGAQLAFSFRPKTHRATRSRHHRVYRSTSQSHDPTHHRPRTRFGDSQDLYGLLVLRTTHDRRCDDACTDDIELAGKAFVFRAYASADHSDYTENRTNGAK